MTLAPFPRDNVLWSAAHHALPSPTHPQRDRKVDAWSRRPACPTTADRGAVDRLGRSTNPQLLSDASSFKARARPRQNSGKPICVASRIGSRARRMIAIPEDTHRNLELAGVARWLTYLRKNADAPRGRRADAGLHPFIYRSTRPARMRWSVVAPKPLNEGPYYEAL